VTNYIYNYAKYEKEQEDFKRENMLLKHGLLQKIVLCAHIKIYFLNPQIGINANSDQVQVNAAYLSK